MTLTVMCYSPHESNTHNTIATDATNDTELLLDGKKYTDRLTTTSCPASKYKML